VKNRYPDNREHREMYERSQWRRPICKCLLIDLYRSINNIQIGNAELTRPEDETHIYVSNLHEISYIAKTFFRTCALFKDCQWMLQCITQTFTVLRIQEPLIEWKASESQWAMMAAAHHLQTSNSFVFALVFEMQTSVETWVGPHPNAVDND